MYIFVRQLILEGHRIEFFKPTLFVSAQITPYGGEDQQFADGQYVITSYALGAAGIPTDRVHCETLANTVHCETLANPWRYPRIAGAAEQNCGEI